MFIYIYMHKPLLYEIYGQLTTLLTHFRNTPSRGTHEEMLLNNVGKIIKFSQLKN